MFNLKRKWLQVSVNLAKRRFFRFILRDSFGFNVGEQVKLQAFG